MADTDNTVLLRVALDEGKTTDRLKQLVLDMEKTKQAQSDLNVMRRNGIVTDEAYAAENVRLQQQLKAQRTETTALTKNLELYSTATKGVADSYQAQQAQLSLAQRQYQLLAGSATNSTEETQALGKVIEELRGTLKTTDSGLGLFVRNVGNYSGAVEPLIAELKRLELQQKGMSQNDPGYEQQQMRIVGFQQAINKAGAEAGLTYEQTQAKLESYGNAIAPVISDLVRLENEQAKVGEGSEAYNRIGFQMQKLKADISAVPAENKKLGDSLSELDETTNVFGGHVGALKDRWQQAKAGAAAFQGGLTGLKGAIAGTGIGLLVIALGLLFEYFTKTDEGAEDLAAGMAGLKAIFSVVEGVVIRGGKALVDFVKNPVQGLKDLGNLIKENVENRFKAAGVIIDAIRKGDFRQLTDGFIQAGTGIENATAKGAAFTAELKRAGAAAVEISRATDELDNLQRKNLVTVEENKNLIDQLVLSAKDRTLSEAQRLANLDRAGRLEEANLQKTIEYANEKLRIQRLENAEAAKTGKIQDEQLQAEQEALAETVRLRGQSATLQQGIQNRRSALLEKEASEDKAAADKRRAQREKDAADTLAAKQNELKTQLGFLDLELQGVQKGSEEELNVLRRKLATARTLELTAKDLTVGQKKLIDAKYEADSLKLTQDGAQKQLVAQLQAAQTLLNAELAGVQAGGEEELRLRQELIERQLEQELAGLDKSQDNTAKKALLQANARKAQADLEFSQSLTYLENRLQAERNRLNQDYAQGLITKQQQEDSLLAIERAGTQARLVVEQDYSRDTKATRQAAAEQEAAARDKRVADEAAALEKRRGYEDARLQAAQSVTDGIVGLFDEESEAGQAALVLKKTLALAEIAINLSRELSAIGTAAAANPLNIPTAGIAGITQSTILSAIAIGKAAVLAAKVLVFRDGGIAQGPSHEQGGIPLYSRRTGRPVGIEIEGGEPVLTAGVSRNPALLAAASAINVAAGGRALTSLTPTRFLAAGGVVASTLVRDSVRGAGALPSAADIGAATAQALRKSPPITRISDVKDGLSRSDFTDAMTNS